MKSTTALSVARVVRALQYSEKGIRSAWRDEAKDCGSAAVMVSLFILGGAWVSLAGPGLYLRLTGHAGCPRPARGFRR